MASIGFEIIFPLITVIMSFLFFLSVTEQFIRKRKTHQLVWAVSMLLFLLTAGVEGLSMSLGFWDETMYRIYYILAAVQVAIMGAGALYLFASRNIINKHNSSKILAFFSIIWVFFAFIFQFRASIFQIILIPALFLLLIGIGLWFQRRYRDEEHSINLSGYQLAHLFIMFTFYIFIFMTLTGLQAPLDLDVLIASGGKEVAGHGWFNNLPGARATIRLFSPLNTVPGAIALIGGAFYSYFLWQRGLKKQTGNYDLKKGLFNIYIGGGALILSIGGTLSGFGINILDLVGLQSLNLIFGSGLLYVSEAISVTLMYFGFLESDKITWQKMRSVLTLSWLRGENKLKSKTIIETGLK